MSLIHTTGFVCLLVDSRGRYYIHNQPAGAIFLASAAERFVAHLKNIAIKDKFGKRHHRAYKNDIMECYNKYLTMNREHVAA